jgi:hypothetical protein
MDGKTPSIIKNGWSWDDPDLEPITVLWVKYHGIFDRDYSRPCSYGERRNCTNQVVCGWIRGGPGGAYDLREVCCVDCMKQRCETHWSAYAHLPKSIWRQFQRVWLKRKQGK